MFVEFFFLLAPHVSFHAAELVIIKSSDCKIRFSYNDALRDIIGLSCTKVKVSYAAVHVDRKTCKP